MSSRKWVKRTLLCCCWLLWMTLHVIDFFYLKLDHILVKCEIRASQSPWLWHPIQPGVFFLGGGQVVGRHSPLCWPEQSDACRSPAFQLGCWRRNEGDWYRWQQQRHRCPTFVRRNRKFPQNWSKFVDNFLKRSYNVIFGVLDPVTRKENMDQR